jgi:hypothetical protein
MKKLYVGCALKHAPQDFIDKVLGLKEILRNEFQILDFLGFTGDSDEVFTHDMEQVNSCEGMVAICDLPSTGLGMEIAFVLSRGQPVFAFAHCDTEVSNMVLGVNLPGYSFHRYSNLEEDVLQLLRKKC